ncbi:MAG: CoA transferase, partial [Burkholderiaceae bacterium]
IALSGALDAIGRAGQLPSPPLNLIGDYGGGSLFLALGMVSALLCAQRTGKGQTVDAAIVDGTASLMANMHGLQAVGLAGGQRGFNLIDSGAYFYDVYECRDGGLVSIAPIEPKFLAQLLQRIGLDPAELPPQSDKAAWPRGREVLAERFRSRTRAEWVELLEGSDACFAPVLRLHEVADHPHHRARGTYIEVAGVTQPAPAPRFSGTPLATPTPPTPADRTSWDDALAPWFSATDSKALAERARGQRHRDAGEGAGEGSRGKGGRSAGQRSQGDQGSADRSV